MSSSLAEGNEGRIRRMMREEIDAATGRLTAAYLPHLDRPPREVRFDVRSSDGLWREATPATAVTRLGSGRKIRVVMEFDPPDFSDQQ